MAERLDDEVNVKDEFPQRSTTGLRLQVEHEALFASRIRLPPEPFAGTAGKRRNLPCRGSLGRLDGDHLRSEVCQQIPADHAALSGQIEYSVRR